MEQFEKRGFQVAKVTVNYLKSTDEGTAETVAREITNSGGRAQIVRADVSKESELDHLVSEAQRFGEGLDIVVGAAGGSVAFRPIKDTSPEDWDRETALNQRSVFFLLQKAAQHYGMMGVSSSSPAAWRQIHMREQRFTPAPRQL